MAMHQHAHQRINIPITIMTQYVKIVAKAIEKENTRDQRKFKKAILAISAYASRMMRLKIKPVDTLQSPTAN